MSILAISFASGGKKELQEGGGVGVTPVDGVPIIDLLGIYPTWETLLPQIVLIPSLLLLACFIKEKKNSGGCIMKKKFLSMTFIALLMTAVSVGQCLAAGFQEYPIGDEKEVPDAKIKVAVVYFQPVPMEPAGMGLTPAKSDIHLETDIDAIEGNETGFGVGEWIPYLTVHYTLTKQGTGQVIEGNLMPMNASDGPHYGANVKMLGAGTYDVAFSIDSPLRQNYMLHTDKETGVPGHFWEKPIVLHWTFDYVPRNW